MVLSAGCAGSGWGEDGPTQPEAEGDRTGDDEAQAQQEVGGDDDETGEQSQSAEGDGDEPTDEPESQMGDGSSQSTDSDSSDSDSDSGQDDVGSDGAQDDEEAESHTLTATVIDPDGEPVEGMQVDLSTYPDGEPVASATTDTNGQVTFEVERGDYELNPDTEDSLHTDFGTHPVAVSEDTEYRIQLSPPEGGYEYALTVQVVDESGKPIPNELVRIGVLHAGGAGQSYITDENGEVTMKYTADSLNEYQDFGITVRGELRAEVFLRAGETHERVIVSSDEERVTHQLDVYAGEVYPIEGVDVTIQRWDGATTTKTTGEDGKASFDVYPGDTPFRPSMTGRRMKRPSASRMTVATSSRSRSRLLPPLRRR